MNKIYRFGFFVLLILQSALIMGQRVTLKMGQSDMFTSAYNADYTTVYIVQDESLNVLMQKHVELNSEIKYMPGYRLQVFFSSSREARTEALQIQKRFRIQYPEVGVYVEYKAPYWRVQIGDFKTKAEVVRWQKTLIDKYPNSWVKREMVLIKPNEKKENNDDDDAEEIENN